MIIITASVSRDRALQAVRNGAQDYLFKSFDMDELKQVVERWVGSGE